MPKMKKRSNQDNFWYWIAERHMMFRKRFILKQEKPWTDDPVLQQYRFCNVFRTLDTVTQHYVRWIQPLVDKVPSIRPWNKPKQCVDIVLNTMLYRCINHPETLDEIARDAGYLRTKSGINRIAKVLQKRKDRGDKIFGSAYVITNGGSTLPKHEFLVECIKQWWNDKENLKACDRLMLEGAFDTLKGNFAMMGPFMAYEVVTDLSYNILKKNNDQYTWANAGPGAKRGLNRFHGRGVADSLHPSNALDEMRELRDLSDDVLPNWGDHLPLPLDMRAIEHSLCEYDKYMRSLKGEGKPKVKYQGV